MGGHFPNQVVLLTRASLVSLTKNKIIIFQFSIFFQCFFSIFKKVVFSKKVAKSSNRNSFFASPGRNFCLTESCLSNLKLARHANSKTGIIFVFRPIHQLFILCTICLKSTIFKIEFSIFFQLILGQWVCQVSLQDSNKQHTKVSRFYFLFKRNKIDFKLIFKKLQYFWQCFSWITLTKIFKI